MVLYLIIYGEFLYEKKVRNPVKKSQSCFIGIGWFMIKFIRPCFQNDYLGLVQNRKTFEKAYKRVLKIIISPKASMLVNGYSKFIKNLKICLQKLMVSKRSYCREWFSCKYLYDWSLGLKRWYSFIDEDYHASGF